MRSSTSRTEKSHVGSLVTILIISRTDWVKRLVMLPLLCTASGWQRSCLQQGQQIPCLWKKSSSGISSPHCLPLDEGGCTEGNDGPTQNYSGPGCSWRSSPSAANCSCFDRWCEEGWSGKRGHR